MHHDPKQLMRTYLEEVVNNGQLDLIDELAHRDVVDEANQAFNGPPGRAGLVAHVKGFRRNIDALDITITRIVGDDTTVMSWWSFTGIHAGPWLGQPAYQSTDYRHRVQLLRPGRRPYQPLPALAPRRLRRPNRLRYLHALQMNEHGDPTKHGLTVASGY